MNIHDCEAVRDLLPLLAGGRLDDVRTRAVADHMPGCADCGEELAVLRAMARTVPAAPEGLERRVLAVAARPPARFGGGRRYLAGFAPAPLAAAATFAAALLGGVLLYERAAGPETDPAADPALLELAWAGGADDPLVQGAAALAELTDEELELLLAEMEP